MPKRVVSKPTARKTASRGGAARAGRRTGQSEKSAVPENRADTRETRRPAPGPWPPDPARVRAVLDGLEALYPEAECELDRRNAFELLCATILSAQCTDERVNRTTPALFARFPDARAMAAAPLPQLEQLIRPTGFFRNKARSLKGSSEGLVARFHGEVPRTLDELTTLPGVARKTANVVLGVAYGITSGIVVDTHVMRLSMRLGLTRSTTPEQIEQDLMAIVPRERWIRFSHQMILHGRRVCFARTPDHASCILAPHCPSRTI